MDKQKQEKQLELPNIETGFYEFITKDTISFPALKPITQNLSSENNLRDLQTSFSF
tara:strand:- start:535 stop:702 length:168 start_codon:yes stop_codon:yes gene_type:complete